MNAMEHVPNYCCMTTEEDYDDLKLQYVIHKLIENELQLFRFLFQRMSPLLPLQLGAA